MKGIVYGIKDIRSGDLIYVGSTRQRLLCMRKGDHTKPTKKQRPVHLYIADHGGWDAYTFECLEDGEFETLTDLRKKEQEWIDKLTPSQNHVRAYLSRDQYLENKRRDQAAFRQAHPHYHRQYADKRKEYDAKRCQTRIQCACGGTYTLQNKTNHFSRQIHKRYEVSSYQIAESQKEVAGNLHTDGRNGNCS